MPTIRSIPKRFPELTPEEAAQFFENDMTVGFSGFTPAGAAKAIPKAFAARAKVENEAGRKLRIGVVTGASTGDSLDGEMARAHAISWRTPYQSNRDLRRAINAGETKFFDMHLSQLPQAVRYGTLGDFDMAVIEAADVTADGQIVLTTSVGATPTLCHKAKKILIELNEYHPVGLRGMHDIYEPLDPPNRQPIPMTTVRDRIGSRALRVDPDKILGVVRTNIPDEVEGFKKPDALTQNIGANVAGFLAGELKKGNIPKTFLPIQSGVGNIANAVLGAMGADPDIPPFEMYSEVIQDSVIGLMKSEDIAFASGCSLTLSKPVMQEVYGDLDFFRDRMVLRPQEISNHPEVVRRLGIIGINTAVEVDIFGNVNSTHLMGNNMMNGIGGSGDFTRNAFISIYTCPSTAKGGLISAIVPLVSHMDHSEHSVQVVITEQGVADLRRKSPMARAKEIIENCVHPDYREELSSYLGEAESGHTRQSLQRAFAMHERFLETGSMKP